MISLAYFRRLIEKGACPDRFATMARTLGNNHAETPAEFLNALAAPQKACHVENLKMSDYDIDKNDFRKYAKKARRTMLGLFLLDPVKLSENDCITIYSESYA